MHTDKHSEMGPVWQN